VLLLPSPLPRPTAPPPPPPRPAPFIPSGCPLRPLRHKPSRCSSSLSPILLYGTMKLVKFLQKLTREQVTIELKNGTVISGTVVGVDATMNAHLKKVKMTVRGKNPVSFATLSVRGSTVRAWLLPDGLNLDALLVEDTPK
ncbi:hypothetical protein ACHAWF_003730, partial [Thalassiosira exigua]